MKKMILSLLLASSVCIGAEEVWLRPMKEEDPHFIDYRCMMIEGSSIRIDWILRDLEDGSLSQQEACEKIRLELWNINYNLGYAPFMQ